MQIEIGARTADEAAIIANSWAKRLRDVLADRYPAFEAAVTSGLDDTQYILRAVRLGPPGAAHYVVSVSWGATQPSHLSVQATALGTGEGGPLKKPFEWIGKAVAAATILWWLYFAVFEADWGRVWSLISSFDSMRKADRGYVFSALAGWGLAPVFYWIITIIGDWLEEKLDGPVKARRQRIVDAELTPWVEQFVRALPGSPVPGRANLVYDATASVQPAPGYTWALDDPQSLEVKPVADRAKPGFTAKA